MHIRAIAGAAVIGGALWIANSVWTALLPEGCVAAECGLPGRQMRDSGDGAPVLLASILLLAIEAVGLVRRARESGTLPPWARFGAVAAGVGLGLILLGLFTQALLFDGDSPYMPYLVIPGLLALVVGLLLVGVGVLRTGILPRWASISLVVGAACMLAFNDQNDQAWFAVPFGISWIVVGVAMWRSRSTGPDEPNL